MNGPSRQRNSRHAGQDQVSRGVDTFMTQVDRFWQRVTEGMKVDQLWSQFQADARASYRLYSRDVDPTRAAGVTRAKHFFSMVGQFFWAVLEKLSPARRVLLLIALLLIIFPGGEWTWRTNSGEIKAFALDFHFYGGLLIFALLILEVGDRVVMKRDLQIAKEIQTWLLPAAPPAIPGLDVAFATRPANTVAGDYYDIFLRPSTKDGFETYLLAVADVAGKSIPAALLMASLQASFKTLSNTPSSLTELVVRMNRYACTNSQGGRRFTTAFLGEYAVSSKTLIYVNAGHNLPFLRRQNGTIERLEVGGVPLGILEEGKYESGSVALDSGDWLIIFTDGVVEAENARGEEYGEARFWSILQPEAGVTAATLLARIMANLDLFVGDAPQHDDVTCMVLRFV